MRELYENRRHEQQWCRVRGSGRHATHPRPPGADIANTASVYGPGDVLPGRWRCPGTVAERFPRLGPPVAACITFPTADRLCGRLPADGQKDAAQRACETRDRLAPPTSF